MDDNMTQSRLGPMWTLGLDERQSARIPDIFKLSPKDISELESLGVEDAVANQERGVRLHGIARFRKVDGVWIDCYLGEGIIGSPIERSNKGDAR